MQSRNRGRSVGVCVRTDVIRNVSDTFQKTIRRMLELCEKKRKKNDDGRRRIGWNESILSILFGYVKIDVNIVEVNRHVCVFGTTFDLRCYINY